jgi:hypothetical protein
MLGLQNILPKKLFQSDVANMIDKEINSKFEKFNHVVPHHFGRVFLVKYFVSLAFPFIE